MEHTYQNFLLSGKNKDNVYISSTYNELAFIEKINMTQLASMILDFIPKNE